MTIEKAYSPAHNKSCVLIVANDGTSCGFAFFDGDVPLDHIAIATIPLTDKFLNIQKLLDESEPHKVLPRWAVMELLRRHIIQAEAA